MAGTHLPTRPVLGWGLGAARRLHHLAGEPLPALVHWVPGLRMPGVIFCLFEPQASAGVCGIPPTAKPTLPAWQVLSQARLGDGSLPSCPTLSIRWPSWWGQWLLVAATGMAPPPALEQ